MAGRAGSMIAEGDRHCRRAGEPILSASLPAKLGEPLVIEAARPAMIG